MEIVTCHYREDLRWLESSPYPVNVVGKEGGDTISLDASKFKSVNIIPNFGLEVSSYLWYIFNNYDALPERMAFIHGHESSIHQRIPILESIEKYGSSSHFVDLNRHMNAYLIMKPESFFSVLWDGLMRPCFGEMPKVVNFRGMAQFAIHRDTVRHRPKWFYEKLFEVSLTISRTKGMSEMLGYFFESFWHIVFGLDSPLEDRPRDNLRDRGGQLFWIREGRFDAEKEDYLDIFLDSNFRVYDGPWEFMQALAKM